ncbi:MAG: hypothetical protein ABIH86_04950 [Planctomycetota bacterium]
MTTDSKPSNVVDIETAESNEDADIKIFGNNPEYQLDVYQMALDYREARQKIASHAIVFIPLLSGIEIMISKYYVFNSKHIFIPLFLLIGSSLTFATYFVAGIGYKLRKPWADQLLNYGLIPCMMSLNFFSITVALIIYKSHCRLKEIVLYISNHHIDIDLDEMSENIIYPEKIIDSDIMIDIPIHSRLYYLERYILRQFLRPRNISERLDVFQTAEFRRAAKTLRNPPMLIHNILPITIDYSYFPYLITIQLVLIACIILLAVSILVYIHFYLRTRILTHTFLLGITLSTLVVILIIKYYKTLQNAKNTLHKAGIKDIESFIKKYRLLHCMLRTYQKRFILSEESGWDENDKTTDHIDSNVTHSTDWQFNTDQKEKQ